MLVRDLPHVVRASNLPSDFLPAVSSAQVAHRADEWRQGRLAAHLRRLSIGAERCRLGRNGVSAKVPRDEHILQVLLGGGNLCERRKKWYRLEYLKLNYSATRMLARFERRKALWQNGVD